MVFVYCRRNYVLIGMIIGFFIAKFSFNYLENIGWFFFWDNFSIWRVDFDIVSGISSTSGFRKLAIGTIVGGISGYFITSFLDGDCDCDDVEYDDQNNIDIPHVDTRIEKNQNVRLLGSGSNIPSIMLTPNKEIVIGRSSTADVIINNVYVSSKHAVISLDDKLQVHVCDLGSSNGTYIEGKKLVANIKYVLQPRERLLIASEDVVYVL